MDLGELERDEKLHRASRELLLDYKASIAPFLWATSLLGKRQIRRRVRAKDADRLVGLLEPHQDNPQLLDPHLNDFIPTLRDAFIASLRAKPRVVETRDEKLLVPLSRAICKLLYTFCKIRGEKVILQFLSTDTAHIELLLSALERETSDVGEDDPSAANTETESGRADAWGWEEQYVTLLWLSLLILNPFDLDSISSGGRVSAAATVHGFTLPPDVTGIPARAIPLAIRYLVAPGKSSDAAKRLLVRVAMRKDMQASGVFRALIQWAISCLRKVDNEAKSDHYYIGILSFLAGILRASEDSTDMDLYLWDIYEIFESPLATKLLATSLARKISIKVQRSVCSLVLRNPDIQDSDSMLNGIVGFLLDTLSDASTPVRLASSKALSVLASKMSPSMAEEVIEEILAALKKGVVVNDSPIASGGLQVERYDLSGVNPSEWHGLILALSHLVYRRSPPASMLSSIISALLLGLSFEKRSPSGSSIGTNVRDAACFGIWALPRRYTTQELQAVTSDSPDLANDQSKLSALQSIATELVISASLDPERNIRRGCSAALQELIGRHPDTIAEGLTLVQTVDYHAVPLRSNAILHVSLDAAKLAKSYWLGISHGLLSWRGVGDPDASTRRLAAAAFGNVFWSSQNEGDDPWTRLPGVIRDLELRLQKLKAREVDERHGLLLCIASIIDRMKYHLVEDRAAPQVMSDIVTIVVSLLQDAKTTTYRRQDLIAEGSSQLINVCCHVLRAKHRQTPDADAVREITSSLVGSNISSSHVSTQPTNTQNEKLFGLAKILLSKWLQLNEAEAIEPASNAAVNLLLLLGRDQQQSMISDLINVVSKSQRGSDKGVLIALLVAYPIAESLQSDIVQVLRGYWSRARHIESRVVILQSIAKSAFASQTDFADIVGVGLVDYTTNARGDVGSLVRIEAVRVAGALWKDRTKPWDIKENNIFISLFGRVLTLGAEKLDRVRIEAQKAIGYLVQPSNPGIKPIQDLPPSSSQYFSFLLNLKTYGRIVVGEYNEKWFQDTLEGYVISADAGSEDLIRASRAALAEYCQSGSTQLEHVCKTLLSVAKENLKNDRVLVPALGTIAFLLDVRIMQSSSTNWADLHRLVQLAHFKTGNIRKLEASVRLYGSLVEVYPPALDKLTKMLLHPIPTIRSRVADTLFTVAGVGRGVNWSKAKKEDLERLREGLDIAVVGGG